MGSGSVDELTLRDMDNQDDAYAFNADEAVQKISKLQKILLKQKFNTVINDMLTSHLYQMYSLGISSDNFYLEAREFIEECFFEALDEQTKKG